MLSSDLLAAIGGLASKGTERREEGEGAKKGGEGIPQSQGEYRINTGYCCLSARGILTSQLSKFTDHIKVPLRLSFQGFALCQLPTYSRRIIT